MPKLKVTAELEQGLTLLQTITGQVRMVTPAQAPLSPSKLPPKQDNIDAFNGCKSVSRSETGPHNALDHSSCLFVR